MKQPSLIQLMDFLVDHAGAYFYEPIYSYRSSHNGIFFQYRNRKWEMSHIDENGRPIRFLEFKSERIYEIAQLHDLNTNQFYTLLDYSIAAAMYNDFRALQDLKAGLELFGSDTINRMIEEKEEFGAGLIEMINQMLSKKRKDSFKVIKNEEENK